VTSPDSAARQSRCNGMCQIALILGLTAAAVTMVLANAPLVTVMAVISGTTFTGAIGIRILTGGPLPRYVRASAATLPPPHSTFMDGVHSPHAGVVQLVRPAEGGGDAAS
jgi:hypothetical protein